MRQHHFCFLLLGNPWRKGSDPDKIGIIPVRIAPTPLKPLEYQGILSFLPQNPPQNPQNLPQNISIVNYLSYNELSTELCVKYQLMKTD